MENINKIYQSRRKILPIILIFAFLFTAILTSSVFVASAAIASDYTQIGSKISNDYLVATANSDGKLALYTTGGNPESNTDNDKRLLYGNLNSGTSKAVISIDGSTRRHTGTPYVTQNKDSLYVKNTYNGVLVECYISFVYNTYTARKDTVEYKYVFTNNSNTTKNVGARIFFDTMLGDNDDAPFRVSGENITTHRTFTGENIPQVWQVFDSYTNSTVVASGTFYNNINQRPDAVQFLYYGNGSHDNWNCNGSGSIGDSAVNVYFNPTALEPNTSKTVKTYYGLSQFVPNGEEDDEFTEQEYVDLDITALAPMELLKNSDDTAYLGNPFSFNGGIQNNGNIIAENVVAVITLPNGLSVDNNILNLGTIEAGENASIFWNITADSRYNDETLQYSVTYYADGVEAEIKNYTIFIPALTHNFVEISRIEATCTTDGIINYECSCGDTRIEIIEAKGHDIETTVETEVTCTSDGLIIDRCMNDGCDYVKRTVIHGEHNYLISDRKEATCSESGYVEYTCSICGDEKNEYFEGKHNYVEYSRVDAQVDIEGSITYKCTACGDSYSIVIPALVPVLKNSAVLLVQNSLPWAEDVNTSLLETLQERGVVSYYNIINTSALATTDLTQYGVVLIANDQTTSMYNGLASNANNLENYVRAGGNLIYGACDEGWGGSGSLTHALPGGVTTANYYSVHNYIVNELHPIVTGVYTDNRSLRDELLKGNYCSHTYFNQSTFIEGTDIILRDANGKPTLIEYNLGEGTIIASGLTWEYFYVRNHYDMITNYSKYAYDDLLTYMIYMSNTCEHEYEIDETVEPTCEENGYTKYICCICSHEYMGDIEVAHGHNSSDWIEDEIEGIQYKKCTICGKILERENLPPVITHIESDWIVDRYPTCDTDGHRHKECLDCGEILEEEVLPANQHNLSDWIVDVVATVTNTGHRYKKCLTCGKIVEEEIIPALAQITIEKITAKAGSTVDIRVNIQNNPGVLGAILSFTYDSGIDLIEAKAGSAWSVLNLTQPASYRSSCKFVWDGLRGADSSNGTILVLTFKISDNASANKVYNISAEYDVGNVVDGDMNSISLSIESGSITIEDLFGDVNNDGIVDVADIVALRRYMAGGYGVVVDETQIDINKDGSVTVADIIELRRYVVER